MTSILLIHPPVAKPGEPPPGIAALAGCLRRHGIACAQLDANLEGLLFLLDQEPPAADDAWSKRALRHRHANLTALRSPELYRNVDRYQRAVRDLNRALELLARKRPTIHVSLGNYQDEFDPLASDQLLQAAAHCRRSPFFPWMEARLPPLLEALAPEWIGLSLCYLSQAVCTFALLGFLRDRYPAIKLVLGGGLLSSWMGRPGWNEPFAGLVDRCIQGPGEAPLLRLLGYDGPITGAAPDYTDLPRADYLAPGPVLPYSASRGCYWNRCTFCPETAEQNRYQPIAPQTATGQLARLCRDLRPNLIHLLDNAVSPALLTALRDQPPGAPWFGFVRFHEQLADVDFCRQLRAAGCVLLKLGLESGCQAVLDAMDKGIRLELAARVFAAMEQAGIATYVYLLFGTPSESLAEARQTMDFVLRHHRAITFLNLAIFNMPIASEEAKRLPGTEFSPADLSLYLDFVHPRGWDRRSVRTFLDREFKRQPQIAAILHRDPPFFTSNHAPFFSGCFPWPNGENRKKSEPDAHFGAEK
ncbi:radical SAM protein [Desulfobulbus sp.]|uniref:B12-binding domain-containing radical SAM protein n=1 Tax=Desulfobulbus sp. TaxID=895 RepID=UPI00286EBFA8|nr:radical SAM protein [Desulfobulbus sp.]